MQTYLTQILAELQTTLPGVAAEPGDRLTEAIMEADKIFVSGAGRSGLVLKAFAMRLMHLGFQVHVVGETTTPGITATDLLLIGSGSGTTSTLVVIANEARRVGAKVALITSRTGSPIGQVADIVLTIPASTPKVANPIYPQSIQPMGSLFEQVMLLTLDALILMLMAKTNLDSGAMFMRHANLE
ncbi:MAG: 6-phospho-3-hexuloisomerase [Anaerolineales bacterium]|nr:6-phospho-3-hexuloisomerase [Anaerolineales bacterium]